ncbi:MAG: aminomethyl-transferring glycine dehydrogenase subunit GcvPA [Candidatus Marinimicrobia bacterium]|nr:aminomethyl-transferring glycine dehydrogenase subunit GcvPA [Candidatus Neomarinimicrobiota bacterium]MDD4961126.1 aminomethyl-transferring glycine dehydrogenase subunit GcvPA [Candidatus Neomarinimicrobiota bacterium]MDD5709357.1 aminomethyl-transferring glycine dehydrogenase subunit GcvPA [Candidatus Neomarinimicrobiota bacterium]
MPFLPHGRDDVPQMLKKIGVRDFEALLGNIPEALKRGVRLQLPEPLSELEIQQEMQALLAENRACHQTVSFLGGGAYEHFIPKVVDFITSRPEFATAYTPYQAEVSQGTLQVMYEFQSMICTLTGMDVSNASMYDAATAMTEAVLMARNITRKNSILISAAVHPLYRQTLETYAHAQNIRLQTLPLKGLITDTAALREMLTEDTAAVLVQSPNFFGCIEDTSAFAGLAHEGKALFIQGVDPLSLLLLKTPGEAGADIVFGEGQALGNHLNFGGPYLGLFAARREYIRKMPGRIAGLSEDSDGKRAFVLTLQTREQHIRREKATSNICSNQALCALAATVYLALMGGKGLRQVAELCLQKAHYLFDKIIALPRYAPLSPNPFFKEFVVRTPVPAAEIVEKAPGSGFFAGIDLGRFDPKRGDQLLIAVTEKRSRKEMDDFVAFLSRFK